MTRSRASPSCSASTHCGGPTIPCFVDAFYGWVGAHSRTRMLVYNQGINPQGPFRLWRYPRAARELHRLLASPRFPAFPPELSG
jgi:hypothetical protein